LRREQIAIDNKAYEEIKYKEKIIYPVTERIAKQGLYLPPGLMVREEEIKKIAKGIERVLES